MCARVEEGSEAKLLFLSCSQGHPHREMMLQKCERVPHMQVLKFGCYCDGIKRLET